MYNGSFLDGLFHREGTFILADGDSYKGKWLNGKFVSGWMVAELNVNPKKWK
tara:strand:+ start:219 stop:374 length:156 start_codon:yes stop_codon:yes gene_type:complete